MKPSHQRKKLGDDVVFECKTYNPVKWTFNNRELPNNCVVTGSNNEKLILNMTKESNEGTYECTIFDQGAKFSSKGTLELKGMTT